MRHDISIFNQVESESFEEAWNRFKNMLRKCPQHGFDKKTQIRFFYTGLLPSFKNMVDASSDGSISTRTIDGAWDLFERMATTSAMWSMDRVVQKREPGVYESWEECGADHSTATCPILAQGVEHADFVQWGQRQQNNPHSETFNPGWRKHPNFSWANQNQNRPQGQYQQQDKKPPLEDMFEKFMAQTNQYMEANNQFMRRTETTLQDQNAAIKNLETQVGQMAVSMMGRAPGNLPSNTEINPKEYAKAITTRSGVQLPEIHVKRSTVSKESSQTLDEEVGEHSENPIEDEVKKSYNVSQSGATIRPVNPHEPPIPFPQRLRKHKLDQ
ncbi:uncharacterized protein LOC111386005 [Olea europaea var. sylvestris]|uniref:uncharacterized protein LOC111386005 n=1 Tax=Olea europaea var. sylvestris TaxID=158386 RepID=UPI000C1D087D|nr:uncharacterized protein LOC111386005 [Olea europaea var. sylvestris]